MTFSIMTLSITMICHYAEWNYALCHIFIFYCAECHCAEWQYAENRHAECFKKLKIFLFSRQTGSRECDENLVSSL
jgi:hypothetical protein